jgi:hypothetical protein
LEGEKVKQEAESAKEAKKPKKKPKQIWVFSYTMATTFMSETIL